MHRRVTIRQKAAPTRNAMNEPVAVWTTLGSFWAEEDEPRSKRMESVEAGQVRAQLHRVWRLRWTERTARIGPLDRVLSGGIEFEVTSATELGRRAGIEIVAIGPVPA